MKTLNQRMDPSAIGAFGGGDPHRTRSTRRPRRATTLVLSAALLALLSAGCVLMVEGGPARGVAPSAAGGTVLRQARNANVSASPSPAAAALPPGIGPTLGARVPTASNQLLLVTGAGITSSDSTAVLYQRTGPGAAWQADGGWRAHNGRNGWTADHHDSDLRTPIGVFALTDAGGLLPDPGSKLTYHQSDRFVAAGTGFNGESLAGVFDYVIAINYNRVPGTSPLDPQRPEGQDKGGGIWIHLDHNGPSHACITLPKAALLTLLHTLDPAQHPVIVMADQTSLAR